MTGQLRNDITQPVLDLAPEGLGLRLRNACNDIGKSISFWRLSWMLAWLDIKLRYRGSILGPFWITASTAVMVAAMGVLYATLFHIELRTYLPFITLSFIMWNIISTVVNEGCKCFTSSVSTIHAMRVPFTVYVTRVVWRNILVMLHNIIVVAVVFAIFKVVPAATLWFVPALLLWLFDGWAVVLLLGTVGARFRDIPPIIASVMQIMFFLTPIIWKPSLLTLNQDYLLYNPFYPVIEVLRMPLMGGAASATLWECAALYSVGLWVLAFVVFMRSRARIAYWV